MGLQTRGWLFTGFLFLAVVCLSEASLAAMSIDLGSQFIKAGIIKPGVPMEIVLNKESRRKTPNLISIRNGERLMAEEAGQIATRYPRNVFAHVMQLLGKTASHPSVALYQQRFPHSALISRDNGSLAFLDGSREFSAESLLAMVLSSVRGDTERFAGQPVADAVLAVPPFFSQSERLAVLAAAEAAGLNVLQLLHSGTAAAVSWGAFHRKDIDGKTVRMLVYDMGATQTTATLVEFSPDEKGASQMRVLGTGWDRSLGGLEMTVRLRSHLAAKWKAAGGTAFEENPRAVAKLHAEAERVKQVLSANSEHVAQVEALHEEKNLRLPISRAELEELLHDLVPRITLPIEQALRQANLVIEVVDHVVLMGAATRTPLVQSVLHKTAKKDLGRFLNTDEAITMGALFQSAHLSKGFKVKPLPLQEAVIFPILATFNVTEESGGQRTRESGVFPLSTPFPSAKPRSIAFKSYRDDFGFDVHYGNLSHLTKEQIEELGDVSLLRVGVQGVAAAQSQMKEGDEWKEVKVGLRMDASGIVKVTSAEAHISRPRGHLEALTDSISGFFAGDKEEKSAENGEEEEKEKKSEEKEEKPKNATEEKKEKEEAVEAETVEKTKKENETEQNTPKMDVTVKEGLVRVKLKMEKTKVGTPLPSKDDVRLTRKLLEKFDREEKSREARAAAENALEALAFESGLLLEDEAFAAAAKQSEKEAISAIVQAVRAWLEDEAGPASPIDMFTTRNKDIHKQLLPVKKRMAERREMPAEMKRLKEVLGKVETILAETEEKKELVEEERKALAERTHKTSLWVQEKDKELKKPVNEDMEITVSEVKVKIETLREAAKAYKRKIVKAEEKKKKEEEKKAKEEEKAEEKGSKEESKEETKTEL